MSESDLNRIIHNEDMSYIGARKKDFIVSQIDSRKGLGGKVVEIGSGTGINLYSFFRNGISNLLGIDYDNDAVQFSKSLSEIMGYDISFLEGNIIDLANIVGTEEARVVIVDSVLEHIVEYEDAIVSIMKTLRMSGLALVIVPSLLGGYSLKHDIDYKRCKWRSQKNNYDPADHVNHFWFREIADKFQATGGEVRECHKFQAYRAFFAPLMKVNMKAFHLLEIMDYHVAQILPRDMATRIIVIEKTSRHS